MVQNTSLIVLVVVLIGSLAALDMAFDYSYDKAYGPTGYAIAGNEYCDETFRDAYKLCTLTGNGMSTQDCINFCYPVGEGPAAGGGDSDTPKLEIITKLTSSDKDSVTIAFDFNNIPAGESCSTAVVNAPENSLTPADITDRTQRSCNAGSRTITIGTGKNCDLAVSDKCTIWLFSGSDHEVMEFTLIEPSAGDGNTGGDTESSGKPECIDAGRKGYSVCTGNGRVMSTQQCLATCGDQVPAPPSGEDDPGGPGSVDGPLVSGVNLIVKDITPIMDPDARNWWASYKITNNGDTDQPDSGFLTIKAKVKTSGGTVVCETANINKIGRRTTTKVKSGETKDNLFIGVNKDGVTGQPCVLEQGTFIFEVAIDVEDNYAESDESDNIDNVLFDSSGTAGENCPAGIKSAKIPGTVLYCDVDGKQKAQKGIVNGIPQACVNNFECLSGSCYNSEVCIAEGCHDNNGNIYPPGFRQQDSGGVQTCPPDGGSLTILKDSGDCTADWQCLSNVCLKEDFTDADEVGQCIVWQKLRAASVNTDLKKIFCDEGLLPASSCV